MALSNLNRQLEALSSTIGLPKAEAVARRIAEINPEAVLHPMQALYNADNRALFFPEGCHYDYIVDAIDLVSCKLDLAENCEAGGFSTKPLSFPRRNRPPLSNWRPRRRDAAVFPPAIRGSRPRPVC